VQPYATVSHNYHYEPIARKIVPKIEGTRPRYNAARDYDVEGADEVFNKIEEDAAHDIIISLNQTQKRK
jgi:hypothetical protein